MTDDLSPTAREALVEKVATSTQLPEASSTSRRVFGTTHFPGKASAVVGMRRAGKTTFLHQLRRERAEAASSGSEPLRHLPYVSFEDERLVGIGPGAFAFLESEFERWHPGAREAGPLVWYLDEIEVVPGWERFVRRLLDSGRAEVVITGSSAALLSREIATSLRGRAWETPIFPFSFEEASRHRGTVLPADPARLTREERAKLEHHFRIWLSAGGFPEAQGLATETRNRLLRDYVDVATLRDVIERHQVSNPVALRWLVRQLLSSPAALFSVEKFYRAMRSQAIPVAKDTVHELLSHLEDCFLIRLVWMESPSERGRMANPRKVYPADSGLIPVFGHGGRENRGHALETAVFVELERRRFEVTYVRTESRHEVDFLARSASGDTELIQVAAELADSATAEREFRALAEAGEMFPEARKRLLTLTREPPPFAPPDDVVVEPAYEWMLTPPEN